ncbi:MAG: DNA repair protein RecO [Clostridia bacterium]|nr:DNA repair protein RecO [Clostridia bacterium]
MQTKKIKTDGLIIKQQNIGEQDRLVTILTRKLGVIRAFVRQGKNIKSRNCASTGLLCYSEFTLFKSKKDYYTVDNAQLLNMFSDLKKELTKLSLAEYFCEVAAVVCPSEQEAEEHLRLILNALYLLSKGEIPELLIKSAVEMRLSSISGYMPDLLMCPRCGIYEDEEMYFLLSGQIFCKNCFEKNPLPQGIKISKSLALALRHLVFSEDKKLFSFSLSESSLKLLSNITEEYLSRKVERNFATLQFYKTVSS